MDRIARSIRELLSILDNLKAQEIDVVFLDQQIDTTEAGGKLLLHIFVAFAEFERDLIRERTLAGLAKEFITEAEQQYNEFAAQDVTLYKFPEDGSEDEEPASYLFDAEGTFVKWLAEDNARSLSAVTQAAGSVQAPTTAIPLAQACMSL